MEDVFDDDEFKPSGRHGSKVENAGGRRVVAITALGVFGVHSFDWNVTGWIVRLL